MAGFGRSPFGRGPFGRSDLGRDLVIELFPEDYLDPTLVLYADETPKDNDKDPLLALLRTISLMVNERRSEVDDMSTLVDYESAPLEIVRLWGDMLGLGIDKNDPEFLQRSFLGNASQWLQIKSSKQGYSVRGLASGFEVSVDNFWRVDPVYESLIPFRFRHYLKPKYADERAVEILHSDSPPGTHAGTPLEEDETYAKSAYVRIVFTVKEPRKDLVDYNKLLDLVIDKIKDVVGIHHELTAPQFLIRLDVATNINVTMMIEEEGTFNADECPRFDITPADVQPLDNCRPSVQMVVGDGIVVDVGSSIGVVITPSDPSISMSASVFGSASKQIEEISNINVEAFTHFDETPGDEQPLDIHGTVSIQIIAIEPVLSEGSISLMLSAEFAGGTGEETIIEVDPATAEIGSIEEQSYIAVPSNVGINYSIGPSFSDVSGSIDVNEYVSLFVNEWSSTSDSYSLSTGIISSEIESYLSVSAAANVLLDIDTGTTILSVSGFPSINYLILSFGEASGVADLSGVVGYNVGETAVFTSSVSGIVQIQLVDVEMDVDVNAFAQVVIDQQSQLEGGASLSSSASAQASETSVVPASASTSVIVEVVNVLMNINVGPTASVQVDPQTQATINVVANPSVVMTVGDQIVVPVPTSMSVVISKVDAELDVDVSVGVSVQVGPQTQATLNASVGSSVVITASGGVEINTPTGVTVVVSKVDALMNVSAALSVGIEVQQSEIASASVATSLSSILDSILEASTIDVNVSEQAQMQRVDAQASIDAGLSVVVTMSDENDYAIIPVSVITSVGASGLAEQWSLGIGSVSAGFILSESVSGNHLVGDGYFVDVFGNFDYNIADEIPVDDSGVVTMTITEGP